MITLRSFFFHLIFVSITVGWSLFGAILQGITRRRQFFILPLHSRWTRFIVKWIGGLKSDVVALDNYSNGPYLFIANHISTIDTFLIQSHLPHFKFSYVVKKSLMSWKYFPFNLGLKFTGAIPVSREANSGDFKKMEELCGNRLENDINIMLFPKGTRDDDIQESIQLPATGLLLAKKLKCNVVPVFFDTENWRNGKLIKDLGLIIPGQMRVVIGKVYTPEDLKNLKDTQKQIELFYQNQLAQSVSFRRPIALEQQKTS